MQKNNIDPRAKQLRDYLAWVIAANERAVDNTGYEFHKGGLKAYRDCMRKLEEIFSNTDKEETFAQSQETGSSPL